MVNKSDAIKIKVNEDLKVRESSDARRGIYRTKKNY